MASLPEVPVDDRHRKELERSSDIRLARFIEGMNAMTHWRDRNVNALQKEAESNEWLKQHMAQVSAVGEQWGQGVQDQDKGVRTRDEVWKSLRPEWERVFSAESLNRLAELSAKLDLRVAGFENRLLAAAMGVEPVASSPWIARGNGLGVTYLEPPEEESSPPPATGSGEVGVLRQGLGDTRPPLTVCLRAPFQLVSTGSSRDGVAVIINDGGVALADGSGFVDTMTFAPILAGGGGSVALIVGSVVTWPQGCSSLSIEASLRFSASMRAMTILGGATCSCELVLFIAMSDGRQFLSTSFIGAATAPLLFFSNVFHAITPGKLSATGIALDGTAGNAQIFAGIRAFSAGVGIVGSSLARVSANFNVDSICATLS